MSLHGNNLIHGVTLEQAKDEILMILPSKIANARENADNPLAQRMLKKTQRQLDKINALIKWSKHR